MSEVITVQDLETLKKHEIFEAEVLTGKVGGLATGADIDYATNQVTGQVQKTMPAILRDIGFTPAAFDFTSGGTLVVNDRDKAVLWPLPGGDGDWYYWEGILPKIIPASSTPYTTGGVAEGAWRPVGDLTLREELASVTGSSMIGLPTGVTLTSYLSSGDGIDPVMPPYNYKDSDSLATRTASLQAAFNAANTLKLPIKINRYFQISSILLDGHTDYTIVGAGAIVGAAASGPYVLGIKNCTGIKGGHGVFVTGPDTGYGCGIKVWGEGESSPGVLRGCSLHTLGFKVSNTSPAWLFGDDAAPDNLLSEIVVEGGYTYNVAEVARVIGSQAVIEFSGYQSIVTKDGGVPFTVKGGALHINGGEVMIPSVTNGYMVQLLPINSPGFDNVYGSCYINGAAVESASIWMIAHNPASVPGVTPGSGKFVMDNCSGFANFAGDNIQSDSSFTGAVVITDTCSFHRTSPKPAGTYISGAASAKVKIAEGAFDANFNVGLQAYRPGNQKPQYGSRKIFTASNLSGQSFPLSAATVMRFSSADSTGENAFYYPSYNPSTGVFTVPAGGLKSVKVLLEFNAIAARPNSELYALIDGAGIGGLCGIPNKFVSQMFDIGDLAAGQTLSFRLTNLDAGFSVGTTNSDRFVISARTE